MSVPRKRKKDRDLPPRMHRKHGAFWHKQGQKWTRLADIADPITAFAAYAEIESGGTGRALQDAINRFLVEHVSGLAGRTQRDYKSICLILVRWAGHMPVGSITSQHVRQLLHEYPSKGRANKIVAVLSSTMGWCVEWGWIRTNPCIGVKRHKRGRRDYLPSHAELRQLREALSPRMQVAMDLALSTALRLSDMLRLKRSDCGDEWLRAQVGKTRNVVNYRWTQELREIVARAKDTRVASLYLLPNQRGQAYTVDGFETNWQRAKTRAGIPHVKWKDLRARALTDAAEKYGKDYAQKLAAHSSVLTTERYLERLGEVWVVDNPVGGRQGEN